MKKNLKKGIAMAMASFMIGGAVTGIAPVFNEVEVYASTYTHEDLVVFEAPEGHSLRTFNDGLLVLSNDEGQHFIEPNGNIITSINYDSVENFSEGLISVKKDDKMGFVDITGTEVIPCIYDSAYTFSEGLSAVSKDGKYGYIDKTGAEVIPFIYEHVYDFSEGLAAVYNGDKYGYIDKTGAEVIPFIYEHVYDFSEGLASVYNGDKYGYIDKTGAEVLPFIYKRAVEFSEGLAAVTFEKEDSSDSKDSVFNGVSGFSDDYSFIDKDGNVVISTDYRSVRGKFENGICFTSEGTYIDTNGDVYFSLPPQFEDTGNNNLSEGLFGARSFDGDFAYITRDGELLLSGLYNYGFEFIDGFAIVYHNNKLCIIKNPLTAGATSTEEVTNEEVIIPEEITPEEVVIPEEVILTEEVTQEEVAPEEVILTEEVVTTPSLVASENNDISTAKNSSIIMIDGNKVDFQAYNIDGNNYFKLRDIAEVLKGTEKQFEVIWGNESNTTHLIRNSAYTTVGGELENTGSIGNMQSKISTIYVDDTPTELQSYNIDGNEYFKLRDLGELIDFSIGWDYKSKVVNVNTDSSYSN